MTTHDGLILDHHITKTCPCNIQNFFNNRNSFGKILNNFTMYAQNIVCGYTLEPPRRGGSNEYTQSMFCYKNKINFPC